MRAFPYQTLLSSVLHRYLSGRLVDEKHVRKSLVLLARRGTERGRHDGSRGSPSGGDGTTLPCLPDAHSDLRNLHRAKLRAFCSRHRRGSIWQANPTDCDQHGSRAGYPEEHGAVHGALQHQSRSKRPIASLSAWGAWSRSLKPDRGRVTGNDCMMTTVINLFRQRFPG